MNNTPSLGDRMKRYERSYSHELTIKTPVIVRVDGRAFHTFTKGHEKPFAMKIINPMLEAAKEVAQEIQGFKLGYVQSDEASFCFTDYDEIETQGWFGYDLSKMISISAAVMTANFNRYYEWGGEPGKKRLAIFDSRCFNIPESEISNYFLWRSVDWERNSLQMYARSFFSHKELHEKSRSDIHEMLHQIGKNWATDLRGIEKNGTFLYRKDGEITQIHTVKANYAEIEELVKTAFSCARAQ